MDRPRPLSRAGHAPAGSPDRPASRARLASVDGRAPDEAWRRPAGLPAGDVRLSGTWREEALPSDAERHHVRPPWSALSTLDRPTALDHLLRQFGATGGDGHVLVRLGAVGHR
ncbi:hypothetical protein [Micromonospora sp. WMMD980]|uniref:hypothetical protein n=1 Tax=Micromonospora sp. WMMD980 TaxID=3016088 RepID=UPI002417A217|nr:hypothetical protein [Micromonospora sp. WMMD980]MDG4800755.1 hypothetical protein [Micromonospora sp. WMMD980]